MSGNILGLGNDIIEIERVRKAVDRHGDRFFARIFTMKEQEYCLKHNDSIPRFAGRFAAKEAIAKAFGTGLGEEISWHDIEVLNDPNGKPEVFFSASLKKRFNNPTVLISISHCKSYANAVAIWIS
jgi:holo-[acyl-carrier protein] synthase